MYLKHKKTIMVQKINWKDTTKLKNALFVDTRAPLEFKEDHIPNSINLPILNDKERAIVGTIYKQVSQDLAIEQGMKFYVKKIPTYTEAMKQYKNKTIIVYCWRGGLRSKIIATLFDTLGYQTYQLNKGYKTYRQDVIDQLQEFKIKPKIFVLHGLTCTGKTEILKQFPQQALDLEDLAQHRGSLYGALNLQPNSQKRFESLLLQKLKQLNNQPFILVEGESRKVGNAQIPNSLWQAMEQADNILIERDLPKRVQEMVREYFTPQTIEQIKTITASLNRVISKKNKELMLQHLEEKEYLKAAEILLTLYYDPLYDHTLKRLNYLFTVKNNNLKQAIQELKNKLPIK